MDAERHDREDGDHDQDDARRDEDRVLARPAVIGPAVVATFVGAAVRRDVYVRRHVWAPAG